MNTRDGDANSARMNCNEGDDRTVKSHSVSHENRRHHGAQPSHQAGEKDEQARTPPGESRESQTGTPPETVDRLNDAPVLGLSLEDTIEAHIRLGNDWGALNDQGEATLHYDCAFELAQKCGDKIDTASLSTFFRHISSGYLAQANVIRRKEGLDNCFTYLDTKERLLNGWASPAFYLELGNIYDEQHPFEFDRIRFYYAKATESTVVDGNDEAAVQTAREKLRIIEKQRSYFATRTHLPAIGQRPRRKNRRKVAAISASGVLLVVACLVARSYIRVDTVRRPVAGKTQGPIVTETTVTEMQPPAARPEAVTPVVPENTPGGTESKVMMNTAPQTVKQEPRRRAPTRAVRRSRPRVSTAARTRDAVNRKAPRKSFAPPSRENL